MISVAESAIFISNNAKHVTVKKENISKLAKEIFTKLKTTNMDGFKYGDDGLHPTTDENKAVDCTFVLDTLNFCFWSYKNVTSWKVNGHTGYYGWVAAFRRALSEGYDLKDPNFYSKISEEQLKHILRSDDGKTEVPLIPTRVKCLHEVGDVLLKKYNGTFEKCIEKANKSAVGLLNIIVEDFPCFRDEGVLDDRKVSFYKRAQILVADIWLCFDGKGLGEFHDIDKITMFADYRVPQALVHFGVLEYDKELCEKLEKEEILDNGSREEMEIRGCSIHAVELVTEEVRHLISIDSINDSDKLHINSILTDNFLWLYRRKYAKELESIPFHKVYCQYY